MSKTTRTARGKEYIPRGLDNKSKGKFDKKFFGDTSGSHSCGVHDHLLINGKFTYVETDRAPIKGKDFVKYNWPCEMRYHKVLKNIAKERQATREINEAIASR